MAGRWRGGFTVRRSGRGLGGLLLSDEADRMATSCRPAGNPSLYGRDRAGMLGNYAADYAASELFAARKSAIYRIACRRIAGY